MHLSFLWGCVGPSRSQEEDMKCVNFVTSKTQKPPEINQGCAPKASQALWQVKQMQKAVLPLVPGGRQSACLWLRASSLRDADMCPPRWQSKVTETYYAQWWVFLAHWSNAIASWSNMADGSTGSFPKYTPSFCCSLDWNNQKVQPYPS